MKLYLDDTVFFWIIESSEILEELSKMTGYKTNSINN